MRTVVNFKERWARDLLLPAERDASFNADEEGSLTIFSLFLFVVLLYIAGTAVDFMHYESERIALQNTVDTAIVAAASLSQEADTDQEIENLVKEYVSKAGFDPNMVTVDSNIERVGSQDMSRSISASVDYKVDTMFMSMMGIDHLNGYSGGSAREGQQMIEIALVLDISGSMGRNSKLENLKVAAKEFVTTMIDNSGAHRVSISVIPYNHQVYLDNELMSRLNWDSRTVRVPGANGNNVHPGTITQYQTYDASAPCASFRSGDFQTRRLADSVTIDSPAYFAEGSNGANWAGEIGSPSASQYWCGSSYPTMIVYQNDETALHNYIDGLSARGWTAIDYGMNWAVGVLDPSFEPVVTHMVDNGVLVEQMRGHPVGYDNTEVNKYVVLMTDGVNTLQADLKDDYKAGPTRIWFSESRANGNEYNGYLVEMPDNPASSRWYAPGSPSTNNDDTYLSENAFPSDAVQWDFHELYERFRTDDVAEYFFKNSNDSAAYNEYRNVIVEGGYSTADANLRTICDTAKAGEQIEVFTVSFEAPTEAEALLQYCASNPGNYFDVEGTQISDAFSAIATQISQLRLME